MQSPALDLKFCGALARVACVILAHTPSRVAFPGSFESTSTKQYNKVFQEQRIYLNRFLFMIVTPCYKFSKSNV